jgi:hypothetical protein
MVLAACGADPKTAADGMRAILDESDGSIAYISCQQYLDAARLPVVRLVTTSPERAQPQHLYDVTPIVPVLPKQPPVPIEIRAELDHSLKVGGRPFRSSLAVWGWTPFSDMQRARTSRDEWTKETDLCWPLCLRCRIHWIPSEAMAQPLSELLSMAHS